MTIAAAWDCTTGLESVPHFGFIAGCVLPPSTRSTNVAEEVAAVAPYLKPIEAPVHEVTTSIAAQVGLLLILHAWIGCQSPKTALEGYLILQERRARALPLAR